MTSRESILEEVRRIFRRDGKPPGIEAFQRETGIRKPEWHGVYWRGWGEALAEAGLKPNLMNQKLPVDEVLRKYIEAVRHYGRIPAAVDIRMYTRGRPDFPGHTTFDNHFGGKTGLIEALRAFVSKNSGFEDVAALLPEQAVEQSGGKPIVEGSVYLLKSGSHYKIGRSDEIEKRVKQITVALPEAVTLVHAITTDAPRHRGLLASTFRGRASERRMVSAYCGRPSCIQAQEVPIAPLAQVHFAA